MNLLTNTAVGLGTSTIGSIGTVVTDTAQIVTTSVVSSLLSGIVSLLKVVTEIVVNLTTALSTLANSTIAVLFQLGAGLLFTTTSQVTSLTSTITIATGSLTQVVGCSSQILLQIVGQCNGIFTSINSLVSQVSVQLGSVVTTTITGIVKAVQLNVQKLIEASSTVTNISSVIVQISSQLLTNVLQLVATIKSAIGSIQSTLASAIEAVNSLIVIVSAVVSAVLQLVAALSAVVKQLSEQALKSLNCLLSTLSETAKSFTNLITSISVAVQCSSGPVAGLTMSISTTESVLVQILSQIGQQITIIIAFSAPSNGSSSPLPTTVSCISKLYQLIEHLFEQIHQRILLDKCPEANTVESIINLAVYDVFDAISAAINILANCSSYNSNVSGCILSAILALINNGLTRINCAYVKLLNIVARWSVYLTNAHRAVLKTVDFIVQKVVAQLQAFAEFLTGGSKGQQGCNLTVNISNALRNLITAFVQLNDCS